MAGTGEIDTVPGLLVEGSAPGARKKPKITLPAGVDSEQTFLTDMRKKMASDLLFDQENRDAAAEDMRFLAGDQWDHTVAAYRCTAGKPVMTINRLPAMIAQVVGNRRLNETVIKVLPDTGGTKEVAAIREGLIRSIQKASDAKLAYDVACTTSAVCGIGNFQVCLEYAAGDVFDQDIRIKQIDDPFAVVWDKDSRAPDGNDAGHVFVVDALNVDAFKAAYPWATVSDAGVGTEPSAFGWFEQDTVRVVSYWRMYARTRMLALMDNGSTVDITDVDITQTLPDGQPFVEHIVIGADGAPVMREAECKYARLYICSGADILEGPHDLPISRVPVFRVPGWELTVDGKRPRWGMVRFLKDPQRMSNYWRSMQAEKLMQSPRAKFIAADTAIAGREKEWNNAHRSDNSLLVYNATSGARPEFVPPAQMEPAFIEASNASVQDMHDVANLHEATMGSASNEVSGKAILARQRVGELGMVVYMDNLSRAIERCGETINALIPSVYTQPRIIKIMGADDSADLVSINDVSGNSTDVTAGKYAVTVTTGPSYVTRRVEASESMLNMVNAFPQLASVAADLVVKYQDWPGADEFVDRIRRALPAGLIDPKQLPADQQQQIAMRAQQQEQQQQEQQQQQLAVLASQLRAANATAAEAEAKAQLAQVNAGKVAAAVPRDDFKAQHQAQIDQMNSSLAAFTAQHAAELGAFKAQHQAVMDKLNALINLRRAENGTSSDAGGGWNGVFERESGFGGDSSGGTGSGSGG